MLKRHLQRSAERTAHVSRRVTKVRPGNAALKYQRQTPRKGGKVRYAVVGLGHIAQAAVLPAFRHAAKNSELYALISDDPKKQRELARRYRVPIVGSYDEYADLLRSGEIDAVYIAVPNSLHCDFTIPAADAGVHVLCEKPLAVTEEDCERMIRACERNNVKLMTAYRLHFEKSNLEAIKKVQSGAIGEPRFFNSIFSMQVKSGNIRLKKKLGGGPLLDLGVYCINAARYLFRAEPTEVRAMMAKGKDKRFREVEEMAGAVLRFPGERLATFVCSFGAGDTAEYQIVGTEGSLRLKNAYEYVMPVELQLTVDGKTQTRNFEKRDQFAPELLYFSNCILEDQEPEPSGLEGLHDVRIIQAIFDSAKKGEAIQLAPRTKKNRPTTRQQIRRPPVEKPKLVRAESGSED
jgi:predicted dehydrogenase